MSLLKELQLLTERTYRMHSGLNLERFIIGRKRFDELSALCSSDSLELSDTARVFFRKFHDSLYMAIYFSDHLIEKLERNDPRRGLHEHNIHPFAVFVEELNHGLHASLKFLAGETEIRSEIFVRDLELLAKIDTYQILKFFMAHFNDSKQLEDFDRLWLRHHLFGRDSFEYASRNLRERYAEATRLGEKYARFLDTIRPGERLQELRRFRTLQYPAKASYIQMLPN